MNRWSRWARQLRARHARTERGAGRGGMVFQRRFRALYLRFQQAGARTSFGVYPRIGITLGALPAAALSVTRTANRVEAVHCHTHSTQVAGATYIGMQAGALAQSREEGRQAVSTDLVRTVETTILRTLPKFLPAPMRRAMGQAPAADRQTPGAREQMATVRAAVDLAIRLRLRSHREEMRRPETPRVMALPVARAVAGDASSVTPRAANTEFAPARSAPPVPPPAPAINVDALTSQVIQQLDRRLIAYQERLGRA